MAQDIVVLKSHNLEPFNQAMAGFVAACPMRITEYDLRGTKKEENSIIQRLTTAKPRLIVAIGPLAAQVAREHLPEIPLIFVMVSNPPKHGLYGANLAGVSLDIPVQTQLAMYKSLVPTLKTLGVIYDPAKTGTIVLEARSLVATLGLQLLAAPVSTPKEVPAALRSLLGKIEALWWKQGPWRRSPPTIPTWVGRAVSSLRPSRVVGCVQRTPWWCPQPR
jgi:putative ABC transport system substrate-binding protein